MRNGSVGALSGGRKQLKQILGEFEDLGPEQVDLDHDKSSLFYYLDRNLKLHVNATSNKLWHNLKLDQ